MTNRTTLVLHHLNTVGVKRLTEMIPSGFQILRETVRTQKGNVEMIKGITRLHSFNYLTNVHRGRYEKNRAVLLRFFRMMERYDKAGFSGVINELD